MLFICYPSETRFLIFDRTEFFDLIFDRAELTKLATERLLFATGENFDSSKMVETRLVRAYLHWDGEG